MRQVKQIKSTELWYYLDRGWEIVNVIQGFGYEIERIKLIKGKMNKNLNQEGN